MNLKDKPGFKSKLVALAFGVSCFGSGVGPSSAQLLEELLNQLVVSHPQILEATSNTIGAEKGIGEARSGYYPTVTVFGDYGYGVTDTPSRRRTRVGELESDQVTARILANQPLFDGFKTWSQVEAATARTVVAEMEAESIRQRIVFQGIGAYLRVLEQNELLELSRKNELTIQQQLSLEDERVSRGSGIELDALFAKSRLQLAREDRVTLEGSLSQAENDFRKLFALPPLYPEMITPSLPIANLPLTREDVIQQALEGNQILLGSKADVLASDADRTAARSDYFPQVSVEAQANYERDVDGSQGRRDEWTVLLRARWKLFDGFLTPSQAARADARYGATMARNTNLSREVEQFAGDAWDEFQTAKSRVKLLQNAVVIAEEVFAARQKLRTVGKETAINVLDAESELFSARIKAVSAEFDTRRAVYRVLLAIGQLTPALIN